MDVVNTEEKIDIAREGLSVEFDKKLTNNVPTLFSVGKLAVMANEQEEYIKIKGNYSPLSA